MNMSRIAKLKNDIAGSYWRDRIVAELTYANAINDSENNRFDQLIKDVEEYLASEYSAKKHINEDAVLTAEGMMSEIVPFAKKYSVHCAGHAHMDMNWMWGFDETVSIVIETFKTVLNLMREYPSFRFSQSQASIYKIIEDYAPELLEEIRQRIREGRWEVTASTWVEADKNMPEGESMARHLLYTKKYLSGLLEINPDTLDIDFEPDTFGHSINVPEVLAKGGVKYYYHCRGLEKYNTYRWKAPSGQSVIVFGDPHCYLGGADASIATRVVHFCKANNVDVMLNVYGVGDHGGGPTRRDLENIIDMSSWPVFPSIGFGTLREYFNYLEGIKECLPVHEGELNFVFSGCYSSQSRIKMANRLSEANLKEAELYNTLAVLSAGIPYQGAKYEQVWRNVLFNQFHDILPGSGVIQTREYCLGMFQDTMALASSSKSRSINAIAAEIDTSAFSDGDTAGSTSEGAGVGFGISEHKIVQCERGKGKTRLYSIFNPAAADRDECVELVIWDWEGDTERLLFSDAQGNTLPHQVLDKGFNGYWGHTYLKVLVKIAVPAYGYRVCVMKEKDSAAIKPNYFEIPRVEKVTEYVLENELVRVCFNSADASVLSYVDKATGEKYFGSDAGSGYFRLIEEDFIDRENPMSAWHIGRYMNIHRLSGNVKITAYDNKPGNIRNSLEYEVAFASSSLKVIVSLDSGSTCLTWSVICNWREIGQEGKFVPQLGFYLPFNYSCSEYLYDVPFGTAIRDGVDMDVPANSFAMALNTKPGKKSLMLVTNTTYSFRSNKDSMALTLLRSSLHPDPYPEVGVHKFKFGVALSEGSCNKTAINAAFDFNHPFSSLSVPAGKKGKLPCEKSFLKISSVSTAVSSIKMPEPVENAERKAVIRVYETQGNKDSITIKSVFTIKKAWTADVCENLLEPVNSVSTDGKEVSFEIEPYSVSTICLEFE